MGGVSKQENVLRMKRELEGLVGKIEELKSLEVGLNINNSVFAYDIVLYSEFDDKRGLDAYQVHPEHLKVVELAKKIVQERAVVDYFV